MYNIHPGDGRHLPDDIFKCMFMNKNVNISIRISPMFVYKGPTLMDWHSPGDKPLSESVMVNLLTHLCVTRPQWWP